MEEAAAVLWVDTYAYTHTVIINHAQGVNMDTVAMAV